MFWSTLWSELHIRLRRPLVAGAAVVGLILTILLVVSAADTNAPPEAIPLRFVLLPLIVAAAWASVAYPWMFAPPAKPTSGVCQSCGFSLAGHQRGDGATGETLGLSRCPECGADPTAVTWKHTTARRIVQAIGVFMLLSALACILFAGSCLALWSGGRLDA